MPAAIPLALIGGSIGGALIGGHSASSAANAQAQAADQAAQLQYQSSQNALDWEKQVFGIQQNELSPFLNTGTNAMNEMSRLLGLTGPGNPEFATNTMPMNGAPGTLSVPNFPVGGFGLNNNGENVVGGNSGGARFMPMREGAAPSGLSRFNAMGNMLNGTTDLAPNGGALPNPNGSATNFLPDAGTFGTNTGTRDLFPTPGFPGGGRVGINTPSGPPLPGSQAANQAAAANGTAPNATPDLNGVSSPNSYFQPFVNWDQTFQAPTALTEQNDPGYQARLKLSEQAIENSAAGKGNLLTGNEATALDQFAQTDASQEYGNVYNRAYNDYITNYNQFQNNQNTEWNRLASLAGFGQTSANTLSNAGAASANNVSNTLLTAGGQIGANINNAAAARASGYVGAGNAYSNMFSGLGNMAMLYSILNRGGGGGVADTSGLPLYPPGASLGY